MNILIAGVPRSGSTRLYNIVRLLLMQKYLPEDLYSVWHDHYDLQKERKNNIVKLHYFDQKWCDWADVIFTTKRDLRYVAASSLEYHRHRGRVYGNEVLLNFLHTVVGMHDLWRFYSDYEMVYEEYKRFWLRDIMNLAEILELEDINYENVMISVEEIKSSLKETTFPYDWNTLMSNYHVSEKTNLHFRERLTIEQTQLIEQFFGNWLNDNGYKT